MAIVRDAQYCRNDVTAPKRQQFAALSGYFAARPRSHSAELAEGGPGEPLMAGLKEATVSAKESDEKSAASEGQISHVLPQPQDASFAKGPAHQPPGEGIGISIVKRLCELLDASLEVASSAETGTTFRVVFPRRYRLPPPEAKVVKL